MAKYNLDFTGWLDEMDERFRQRDDSFADTENASEHWQAYDSVVEAYNRIFKTVKIIKQDGTYKWRDGRAILLGKNSSVLSCNDAFLVDQIAWTCPEGHVFKAAVNQINVAVIQKKPVDEVCSHCKRIKKRAQTLEYRDPRLKLSLVMDERNQELLLDTYTKSNAPFHYRACGSTKDVEGQSRMVNLEGTYRSHIKQNVKHVSIAQDGEYAFVWAGPWNNFYNRNPLTRDLINNHDDGFYFGEDKDEPSLRGMRGIKTAIEELVEDGAKVLNIMWNPQYESPGVYDYGDLTTTNAALANYLTELEGDWLDWQQKKR